MSKITERIERELAMPGLTQALAERIEGSDLQSLLLEVYRRRASRKSPPGVLAEHEASRFTAPSRTSPLELLEWEQLALSQLPAGFLPLELSPVAVVGACSALAPFSQDRVISALRNTEVAADPTNGMALEAALRRRDLLRADSRSREAVHLAASQRVVRTQRYPDPTFLPHFRVLALCSAGRDAGLFGFEKQALALHIGFYLSCIRAYVSPAALRLSLLVEDRVQTPALEVLAEIRDRFSDVDGVLLPPPEPDRDYYRGFRFQIAADGMQLVDGGAVDWSSRLLSNEKERLLISGIGSERICALRRRLRDGS